MLLYLLILFIACGLSAIEIVNYGFWQGVLLYGLIAGAGFIFVLAVSVLLGKSVQDELYKIKVYKIVRETASEIYFEHPKFSTPVSISKASIDRELTGNTPVNTFSRYYYRNGGWRKYWLLPVYDDRIEYVVYRNKDCE